MAALLMGLLLLAFAGLGIAGWRRRRAATEAPFPAPRLADYTRWSQVMREAYAALCRQGSPVLDDYGAEGPGEFFAVATEAYFQRAVELQAHHPQLYALLRDYYQIETAGRTART